MPEMSVGNTSGNPRQTPAWTLLEQHARDAQTVVLWKLLDEPDRYANFSLQLGDLCLDYSRQRVTAKTLCYCQNLPINAMLLLISKLCLMAIG
jgi:hypothetical protein